MIPGQRTRSRVLQLRVHMLQLKIPHVAMNIKDPTCCNQDPVLPDKLVFLKILIERYTVLSIDLLSEYHWQKGIHVRTVEGNVLQS